MPKISSPRSGRRSNPPRVAAAPKRVSHRKTAPRGSVAAAASPHLADDIPVEAEEFLDDAYSAPARPILARALSGALGDVAGGEWSPGDGIGVPRGRR